MFLCLATCSGYEPEQCAAVGYSYAFGWVNDPKVSRVLVLFTNGTQREVQIQAQAFVAAVPLVSGIAKVECVDKAGKVIESWEAPS